MEWVLEKAGQSKEPKGKSFLGNCVLLLCSPPPPLGARVLAFPRKFCDNVVAHVRSKYTGICGVCTVVNFFSRSRNRYSRENQTHVIDRF